MKTLLLVAGAALIVPAALRAQSPTTRTVYVTAVDKTGSSINWRASFVNGM